MSVINQADVERIANDMAVPEQAQSFRQAWAEYETAQREALATAGGKDDDDAIRAAATEEWLSNDDSEDAANYKDFIARIDSMKDELDEIESAAKGLRDRNTQKYFEATKANFSTRKSTANTNYRKVAGQLSSIVGFILMGDSNAPEVPLTVSDLNKSMSGGPGRPRFRLESATVDNEPVLATGKFVTVGNIATVLQAETNDVIDAILEANDSNRELTGPVSYP